MTKVSFPWMTGKLKTALYLVSAVTGLWLAACSDETESPAIPDENPLAVNVMTEEVSRGLVHGKFLPDAAEIGVSLYTTDGAAYRTGYENLKYIASGTGDAQSWSTTNIPTLSSIEAKLVAYYPWAENTDYSAVPVETDTQTDYMYSQWLNGLSNANNEAYITMDHALTAVRLSLFNDGFSAEAEVTALGIKSEALGTSATLDASTGNLTGIQGIGTEFAVPADFKMAAQATDTEILMVPDVDKTAGVTTLTATINGKKYAANINFTESYKQGYIYTYTLALKNTGLSVVKVSVTPWQEGTQDTGELGVEDKKYTVDIITKENNVNYIHNVIGFTGTIDWGDGNTEEITVAVDNPSHTYLTAGEYTVTATGTCSALCSIVYMDSRAIHSRAEDIIWSITKIKRIGKDMGITDMTGAFYCSSYLTSIKKGAFDGLVNVVSFENTFGLCAKLTSIPEGLFDNCPNVTTFEGTFSGTNITSIPTGLFDNNINVISFLATFHWCSNIKTIPIGLFDNNTKVTSFDGTFFGCTKVTSVPAGLFDKNINSVSFHSVFSNCDKLKEIPAGLFDNCTEVQSFQYAFNGCKGLTNIPEGLFDNNTKVTSFGEVFLECEGLTGESPYTTINVNGNDVKVHLYERANYPEHFTAPVYYGSAFKGCTGLTDYANIPAEWKGE